MNSNLILLWLAALPLMGSPGPATVSLAGIGSAYGFRAGLRYLTGIILGTTAVLVLIASGLTGLLLAYPALARVIAVAAATYILFLAYRIATAPTGLRIDTDRPAPAMLPGLLLAIGNPKAYAAIGAVYVRQALVPQDPLLDALAKTFALLLVVVVVNTVWLAFGSALATLLRDPRRGRVANIGFAVLLLISVFAALAAG
ncbi:MAG: LysE family transporter [Burkholderiaceae bacterium]